MPGERLAKLTLSVANVARPIGNTLNLCLDGVWVTFMADERNQRFVGVGGNIPGADLYAYATHADDALGNLERFRSQCT